MSLKNRLKHFLGQYPSLFFSAYRLTAPKGHIEECLFSPEKELVIEGFPRSANTFAVVAFRQAQGRNVPMGHHLHVEAQVLKAVKLKKPCMVLIRNPDDAIRSLKVRHPDVDLIKAYRRWLKFYSAIVQVSECVLIADFSEVTTDFGGVIERFNKKFGVEYKKFVHSESNVKKVYEEIERINKKIDKGKETHVARPSKVRHEMVKRIHLPDHPVRKKALSLYDDLTCLSR